LENNMSNETPADLRDVQPTSFSHIIGQRHVVQALRVATDASFQEGKRLDEILLCGPPGLGKSALVAVLASELAVPFTEVLAQSVTNAAELNAVLLSAAEGILFLDEIHLLHPVQQHALLQVLDKRRIFISGGKAVQSIPVAPFTLVGATTDPDGVIAPLIDRFRMVLHLDYYSFNELAEVVCQRCRAMGWQFDPLLLMQIAKRSRQTPRIALRILQSARRCAVAEGSDVIGVSHLNQACHIERVSPEGLDHLQQKYVALLTKGALRLNVLASALGVSAKVLTKTVEPYLIRAGYVVKDEAGRRALSDLGRETLGNSSNIDDQKGGNS
jgi:Holliday junction DNA helicase RuvB